jgi:hypothetical protein
MPPSRLLEKQQELLKVLLVCMISCDVIRYKYIYKIHLKSICYVILMMRDALKNE